MINGQGWSETVRNGEGRSETVRDGGDGQGRSGTMVSRWWTERQHGSRWPENGNGTVMGR